MISKYYKIFLFLVLSMFLAAVAFVYQTFKGLGVTGLNEPVVWGMYIANFTFCLGMGAGILFFLPISASTKKINATHRFFISLTALISLAMAGVFIMLDLGRIDRFYFMMMYP